MESKLASADAVNVDSISLVVYFVVEPRLNCPIELDFEKLNPSVAFPFSLFQNPFSNAYTSLMASMGMITRESPGESRK